MSDEVINRDVPIAEENITLTGQPAINDFEEWSTELTDRADNVYTSCQDQPADDPLTREKRIRELDELIHDKID